MPADKTDAEATKVNTTRKTEKGSKSSKEDASDASQSAQITSETSHTRPEPASTRSALTRHRTQAVSRRRNLAPVLASHLTPCLPGFLGLCDDEWILILRQLIGDDLVIRLNDSRACRMVSVLFRINKAVRGIVVRIIYKCCKFTAGVEILCRPGSLQCRQQLRLDTIRYIPHLTIPGKSEHSLHRTHCF